MSKVIGTDILCGYVENRTFTQFAYSRKASVQMDRDMIEVSSPSTGDWEEYIPGRKGWKMSCGCLLSSDESKVWNLWNDGTLVTVSWREQGKFYFQGTAYIKSIKAQGNIHDMASFDIELQGTGALSYICNTKS